MNERDTSGRFWLAGSAGACLLSLAAYFGNGASSEPAPIETASVVAPGERARAGMEADQAALESWRESQRPSAGEARDERETKELARTMRLLGTSPIEIAGDDSDPSGLRPIESMDDLRQLLAKGGEYAGPLPPELMPQDGDAPHGDRR
jgi:hypothetical protein